MASLLLKNVPEPVRKIIVREQSKQKEKIGSNMFGLEQTIYKIIQEWEKCRKDLPTEKK